ncbi:mitochondrial dicarboxylate/tricarboxylate transporter DTC [Artemisia annua]|uniref:Mitochondrial dicarboxylate/tricarboxylate transporter DTC n=1 Tax=Artemisia annua TaxID=35608 RepID=A0A2U1M6H8_ARTAN|nr:mitochondrial dicarboxylate/tricarboxylate transporter DTC [Artemisia annua]
MGDNKLMDMVLLPNWMPLLNMMDVALYQPFDMVKVTYQLTQQGYESGVAERILKNYGIPGFYKGLSAGLLKEAIYSPTKLGSMMIWNKLTEASDGKPVPLCHTYMGLLTASAIGTFVGCPADLAMIRKQANATLHYKHAFLADEGIFSYWKGAVPTVARSMALELGIIAVYYPSVKFFKEDCGLESSDYLLAADVASLSVAAVCSAPFDYVKTQMQTMQPDAFGKYPYTGPIDCAKKVLKSGGPKQFYRGIGPYIFRSFPQAALTVAILRDLRKVKRQN